MQFDVIIGNPPYQLSDNGFGASSMPIYQHFVQESKALNPKYISMVIPSRWLFGGRGLDSFRKEMLEDTRLRSLHDFADSRYIFPSVDVAGGVCYFLWQNDYDGTCEVNYHNSLDEVSIAERPLLEDGLDVFIRSHLAVEILKKIAKVEDPEGRTLGLGKANQFSRQVSSQKPFGLRTYFRGKKRKSDINDVLVLQSGGHGWTNREEVKVGNDLVDKWKVFTSKSSSEHAGQADSNGQRRVLSKSGILPPQSVVTETYILLGAYGTREEALNCFGYATTKFFRFLLATRSSAQDLAKSAYSLVPLQDFNQSWSDEKLYDKYQLDEEEIRLIDRLIKPMDVDPETEFSQ